MEKKRSPLQFKFLSAGPFVMDISRAGSSIAVFELIVLTPVCQFHPFGGFSLLLSALAGVHDLAIFAGRNSALNCCVVSWIPVIINAVRNFQSRKVLDLLGPPTVSV